MRQTPLYEVHEGLGARIVEFAGWQMPVWYEGISAEHQAVRTRVGLFDVSHMGEFALRGPGAVRYLRRMLTNDAAALVDGQAHYTIMPNDRGGTVDDLLLYRMGEEDFLVVVNASNIDKDRSWLEAHLPDDVELEDISDATALLALQGPRALDVLPKLTSVDVTAIKYYHFVHGEAAGIPAMISRTGYTGEDGFELMIASGDAVMLWHALVAAGVDVQLAPAGLGARDSLRLEAAMALYGHELDDETSALEAGLGFFVKLDDKTEMMGLDRYKREKADGLGRTLVGLKCTGRGIPRQGYTILGDGEPIGTVTSGTLSPTLEVPIAMGFVSPQFAKVGTELAVDVRGREVPAQVVKRPFYRRDDRS